MYKRGSGGFMARVTVPRYETEMLFDGAALGLLAGMKCCGHMDERRVRRITVVLLILSGVSLILKNLP